MNVEVTKERKNCLDFCCLVEKCSHSINWLNEKDLFQ